MRARGTSPGGSCVSHCAYCCREETPGPLPVVSSPPGLAYFPGRGRGHADRDYPVPSVRVGVVRAGHRVQHREADIDHRVADRPGSSGRPAGGLVRSVRGRWQRAGVRQRQRRLDPRVRQRAVRRHQRRHRALLPGWLAGGRRRNHHHGVGVRRGVLPGRGRGVLQRRHVQPAGSGGGIPGIRHRGEQRGDQLGPGGTADLCGRGDGRVARSSADSGQQCRDRLHRTGEHRQRVGVRGGHSQRRGRRPNRHRYLGQEH